MIWKIKAYTNAYREKQAVIFINDRRGGYKLVIDLVSPSPEESQPHHNADIFSNMSLKSISSIEIPPAFLYSNSLLSNTKIYAQFIEVLKVVLQSITFQ